VSKWETGKNLPETALLPSISEVLEESIDSILTPPYIPIYAKPEIVNEIIILDEAGGGSIAKANEEYYIAYGHNNGNSYDNGVVKGEDSEIRMITSQDGLKWGTPKTIFKKDGFDPWSPCIHSLADGTILVTFYRYRTEPAHKRPMLEKVLSPFVCEEHHDTRDEIAYLIGQYVIISNDGGKTFSDPCLIEKNCAFVGKIVQLSNGIILAPLCRYGDGAKEGALVVYASMDGGFNWEPYSYICDSSIGLPEEPSLFKTWCNRLYCFIRAHKYMYYSISIDNGRTWSDPINSKIPGDVRFDALQLSDGSIVLYYGTHYSKPEQFGLRTIILKDGALEDICRKREILIKSDSKNNFGYTWAELLQNGDVLFIYGHQDDNVNKGQRFMAGTVVRF
jgi:hypothetical protein